MKSRHHFLVLGAITVLLSGGVAAWYFVPWWRGDSKTNGTAASRTATPREWTVTTVHPDPEGPLIVKHNPRIASSGGWRTEVWTTGSACPPGEEFWVVCRVINTQEAVKGMPTIKLQLSGIRAVDGQTAVKQETRPAFKQLGNEKGRETKVEGWQHYPVVPSPNPKQGWIGEANFRADFGEGSFLVYIGATFDDGTVFEFEAIPFSVKEWRGIGTKR